MSWGDMAAEEQATTRILAEYAPRIGGMENAAFENSRHHFGVSFRQGYRKGFRDCLAWVLHTQSEFARLPADDQIREFDKGPGSIYYPLLRGDEL